MTRLVLRRSLVDPPISALATRCSGIVIGYLVTFKCLQIGAELTYVDSDLAGDMMYVHGVKQSEGTCMMGDGEVPMDSREICFVRDLKGYKPGLGSKLYVVLTVDFGTPPLPGGFFAMARNGG